MVFLIVCFFICFFTCPFRYLTVTTNVVIMQIRTKSSALILMAGGALAVAVTTSLIFVCEFPMCCNVSVVDFSFTILGYKRWMLVRCTTGKVRSVAGSPYNRFVFGSINKIRLRFLYASACCLFTVEFNTNLTRYFTLIYILKYCLRTNLSKMLQQHFPRPSCTFVTHMFQVLFQVVNMSNRHTPKRFMMPS